MLKFTVTLIQAWLHRRKYWKVVSDRVIGGCQGDWREVKYECDHCKETIVATSKGLQIWTEWSELKHLPMKEIHTEGKCPARVTITGQL